jgi:HK97 family phage prohead protease
MKMQKLHKTSIVEAKEVSELGVVSGVLNAFGNKDFAGDITMKGAFTKSLLELVKSGRDLVVLWQHDSTRPIGIWKNLRETERGLEGDAHLNLDVELAREAFALVKQGALSGFSIGYYVMDESYDPSAKVNRLNEISLVETSLVTFPCNDLSRTEGIKMKLKDNELPTVRELEATLKEIGYSNTDAKYIVSKYMPDYVDAEEKARVDAEEKATAQAAVEALIKQHGLKYMAEEPEDEKGAEDDEEESKKEEDDEEETEEKSKSMDASFFTK